MSSTVFGTRIMVMDRTDTGPYSMLDNSAKQGKCIKCEIIRKHGKIIIVDKKYFLHRKIKENRQFRIMRVQ